MPGSGPNTITKKELVTRISEQTGQTKVVIKDVLQRFLDEIITELAQGNRLEFREFGVFEVRDRAGRVAQNPRTLAKVSVPSRRAVKFKVGRLMRERVIDALPPKLPSTAPAKSVPLVAAPQPLQVPRPPSSNSPF